MNKEKILIIILILISSATIYCQKINYSNPEIDERINKFLIETDKLLLSNGNLLVRRKELFVDIFKQSVYPQELVVISPKNEINAIRSIKDTIIFKLQEIDSIPHIFFADKQGLLKFVGLDSGNLSFTTAPTTIKGLNPLSKKPTKINDYTFPEILFSENESFFTVIQTAYCNDESCIDVSVHSKAGNLIYERNIQSKNQPENLIARISNEGQVFLFFLDGTEAKIHATTAEKEFSYLLDPNAKKKIISRSDLIFNQNKDLIFFELILNRDNHLETIKHIKLSPELDLIDARTTPINLYYPPMSVKSSAYQSLFFNSISELDDNEMVLLFEYCTPPPQATLLGTMITQKPINTYIRNGTILGIHLDSSLMPISNKLFYKKGIGQIQFINENKLNFITNNHSKKEYLKHTTWNFDTDKIQTEIVLKKDKSKHYQFDLSNSFLFPNNNALIFGWKKRRLILSW